MSRLAYPIIITAVGLGATFQLYGICIWGVPQLLAETLAVAGTSAYTTACLLGSLGGFLVKPLSVLLGVSIDRLQRQGTLVFCALALVLLFVGFWSSNALTLIVAGLLAGLSIASLSVFWLSVISIYSPTAIRNTLTLSLVVSVACNATFIVIPPSAVLFVVFPILGLIVLAVYYLVSRAVVEPLGAPRPVAETVKIDTYKKSLWELTGPLSCALVLLLVIPTINYVALGDGLGWQTKSEFVCGAQLLATAVLFILLTLLKRSVLTVTFFIGIAPFLVIALFLFPFLDTEYRYVLLLIGSFLHFAVTILIMADCIKVAAQNHVDPAVPYGLCGAITFLITFFGERIMGGVLHSSVSRDIQMVASAFLLIFLFGVVFLFVLSKRQEKRRLDTAEDASAATAVAATLAQSAGHWDAGGRELECCRYLQSTYGLSDREADVLLKMLHGKNAPTIAEELFLSQNTVRSHIKRIYRTMTVHSRQELIRLFEKNLDQFPL
jgi:DNA-binding CsgD family transcriptional regulator/MFS family permease